MRCMRRDEIPVDPAILNVCPWEGPPVNLSSKSFYESFPPVSFFSLRLLARRNCLPSMKFLHRICFSAKLIFICKKKKKISFILKLTLILENSSLNQVKEKSLLHRGISITRFARSVTKPNLNHVIIWWQGAQKTSVLIHAHQRIKEMYPCSGCNILS